MEYNYCCKYKCFSTDFDHVDGMACNKCKYYGYCKCKCLSYKNSMKIHNRLKNYILNLFK